MSDKNNFEIDGVRLKHLAEERLRTSGEPLSTYGTGEDPQRLLHELHVHQIELEMQNEELRHSREEVEKGLNKYLELYDFAPVGYFTLDRTGNICSVNLTGASFIGINRSLLIGQRFSKFIAQATRPALAAFLEKVFNSHGKEACEATLLTDGNPPRFVQIEAVADASGQEVFIAIIDITELKQAEEAKIILLKQLHQAQKMESLGVLAGGIAHDFNNCLMVIVGHCSMMNMKNEPAEKHIQSIEKAAERATELCRQMLAYAGKSQSVKSQVNMVVLMDELVEMLKATIKANAVIKLDNSPDIPFVKGDASQISQLIMNLIINAAEAINEAQGEINVSLTKTSITAAQSVKDFQGKVIPPGCYVCLEVTDNGCGMDDGTIHRIFEPFFTTKFTGRGLGMSAVQGIITSHSGALQLYSQPNQGTTFKVFLPVKIGESAGDKSQELPHSSIPWQGSGTILLVEDEESVKYIAKIMLENLGFTVLEAANGKEALELYKERPADITLVVTELNMPVMDGWELIRELKELDEELPIVVSTDLGDTVVTSKLPNEGIARFVCKPYHLEQLREVLKSVVAGVVPQKI